MITRGPAVVTWDEGLKEVGDGQVVIATAAQATNRASGLSDIAKFFQPVST